MMLDKLFAVSSEDLKKDRFFLFGIACLWIFFRHTIHLANFSYWPVAFDIFNIGDAGVDVFLFLSGYGLFFSYERSPIKSFYIKRFLRVIPTYLIFYLLSLLIDDRFSLSLFHFLRLTFYEYWYILFILIAYILYPVLCYGIKRIGLWFFVLSLVLSTIYVVFDYYSIGGSQVTVYISRVPVFILGSIFADKKNRLSKLRGRAFLWLFIIGICAMWLITMEYKCFRRLFYLPLILGVIPLVCNLSKVLNSNIRSGVEYIGQISLEFYLVHCLFMIKYIVTLKDLFDSQLITLITLLGITIVLSWILQTIITPMTNYLHKLLVK